VLDQVHGVELVDSSATNRNPDEACAKPAD
jgi:hypothetical protein